MPQNHALKDLLLNSGSCDPKSDRHIVLMNVIKSTVWTWMYQKSKCDVCYHFKEKAAFSIIELCEMSLYFDSNIWRFALENRGPFNWRPFNWALRFLRHSLSILVFVWFMDHCKLSVKHLIKVHGHMDKRTSVIARNILLISSINNYLRRGGGWGIRVYVNFKYLHHDDWCHDDDFNLKTDMLQYCSTYCSRPNGCLVKKIVNELNEISV